MMPPTLQGCRCGVRFGRSSCETRILSTGWFVGDGGGVDRKCKGGSPVLTVRVCPIPWTGFRCLGIVSHPDLTEVVWDDRVPGKQG